MQKLYRASGTASNVYLFHIYRNLIPLSSSRDLWPPASAYCRYPASLLPLLVPITFSSRAFPFVLQFFPFPPLPSFSHDKRKERHANTESQQNPNIVHAARLRYHIVLLLPLLQKLHVL